VVPGPATFPVADLVCSTAGDTMTSVAAGSKLLIHGTRLPVVLRSLRDVDLNGGWTVPVMADVAAFQAAGVVPGRIVVEFPTSRGPIRIDAELVQSDQFVVLRAPGLRPAAMVDQRRESVRGTVQLRLRGTILTPGAKIPTRSSVVVQDVAEGISAELAGHTATVSAGGISADLPALHGVGPGATVYLELELPAGDLAPAVMTLLEHTGSLVRARFLDISPLDRERLVRLVFARQRTELAERSQLSGPS
jgi:PilZ domain